MEPDPRREIAGQGSIPRADAYEELDNDNRSIRTRDDSCAICKSRSVGCQKDCPFWHVFRPTEAKSELTMKIIKAYKDVYGSFAAATAYGKKIDPKEKRKFGDAIHWQARSWHLHPSEGGYYEVKKANDDKERLLSKFDRLKTTYEERFSFIQHRSFGQWEFALELVKLYISLKGDMKSVTEKISACDVKLHAYENTFIEVVFMGSNPSPAPMVPPYFLFDCEPKPEQIKKHVQLIEEALLVHPLLMEYLKRFAISFLCSLGMFQESHRKVFAIFLALSLSQDMALLTIKEILTPLSDEKDNVETGVSFQFLIEFFKQYILHESINSLIDLIMSDNVEGDLLQFLVASKGSMEQVSTDMSKEGLGEVVEHIRLHEVECKLVKFKPGEITSVIDEIRGIIGQFPAVKVFPLLLRVIFSPVKLIEKDVDSRNAQIIGSVSAQVSAWKDLLGAICDKDSVEVELLDAVQKFCFLREAPGLTVTIFQALLFDKVVSVKTILQWSNFGNENMGRDEILERMKAYITCLRQVEEIAASSAALSSSE